MAIAIRLARGGMKKKPYYRIIVADSRNARDGKFIEKIGTYNPLLPKDSPDRIKLDTTRAAHWLSVGAQPSDRVARFLDAAGVRTRAAKLNPVKGLPGEKAKERAQIAIDREAAAVAAAEEAEKAAKQAEIDAREAADAAAAAAAEAAAAPAEDAVVEHEVAAAEMVAEGAPADETPAAEATADTAADTAADTTNDTAA